MNEIRIVYSSGDRVCLAKGDVVVTAERNENSLEAHRVGTGGPMSGELLARSVNGLWETGPDEAVDVLVDEMFAMASRLLREAQK